MTPLIIPLIKDLDSQPTETKEILLERHGVRIAIDKVNWPEAFPDHRLTTATVAHDGKSLFIDFFSRGEHLKADVDADLGPVANDSCVEFFVSPEPERGRYWNFEFNAIGRKNVSTRIERPNPRRLSPDELAMIQTYPSAGTSPFGELDGLHCWNLLVVIPLSLIGITYTGKPVEMKGNFYKCGGKTSSPHYLSWAPIHTERPDFHRPDCFATIILE